MDNKRRTDELANSKTNNMRDFARSLYVRERQQEISPRPKQPAPTLEPNPPPPRTEHSISASRPVQLNPRTLAKITGTSVASSTESASAEHRAQPVQPLAPNKLIAGEADSTKTLETAQIQEYATNEKDRAETLIQDELSPLLVAQHSEPLAQVTPAHTALIGLRPVEIKRTAKALKEGSLRPSFYVPHSARRCHSFAEVLDFSREVLPLPREMQLALRSAHSTWLVAQLARCDKHKALSDFAFSLNYKDLATLFPTLAALTRGEEIDKIISIIMMRASKYLYLQGWITLQYAYPRSTVQKGLSELCEILESAKHPYNENLSEEEKTWFNSLNLGAERFDWKSIHLISEINLPNTRHFLTSIIKHLRENKISGEEFFHKYGIYRDLHLGQAIQSQWDMAMFENRVQGMYSTRKLFSTPNR